MCITSHSFSPHINNNKRNKSIKSDANLSDHSLALFSVLVAEDDVVDGLLLLEGNVAGEDEAVLQALGHAGMTSSMVEHKTL